MCEQMLGGVWVRGEVGRGGGYNLIFLTGALHVKRRSALMTLVCPATVFCYLLEHLKNNDSGVNV